MADFEAVSRGRSHCPVIVRDAMRRNKSFDERESNRRGWSVGSGRTGAGLREGRGYSIAHTTPLPGHNAPRLAVEVIGGQAVNLATESSESFTLIFFYRGFHCPICRRQLEELSDKLDEFDALGVKIHVVSMDTRDRAERQKREWAIDRVPIGYGLTEESAREWGLFISAKAKDAEPARFAEPRVAVVDREGRIYALYLQSVPFARPAIDTLRNGLKFIIENGYPVRGQIAA